MHRHRWDFSIVGPRLGVFRCLSCRALVALEVLPLAGSCGFGFHTEAVGLGVSSNDLQVLGDWCVSTVGRSGGLHYNAPAVRHRRKRAA
jgi:hypothetical protein